MGINKVAPDSTQMSAWLKIAYAEIGQRRAPAGLSNARIEEYNNATTLKGYDDKISWCSAFVNWCLAQSGVEGTRSALARSWIEWGVPVANPVQGCIVVVSREEKDGWKGHVGFFIGETEDSVVLLGGNQDEQVKTKAYPKSDLLALRLPAP